MAPALSCTRDVIGSFLPCSKPADQPGVDGASVWRRSAAQLAGPSGLQVHHAGEMISPGVQSVTMGREESTPDLRSQRYAEVAALQNSLAHMSMPHSSELGVYGHSTPPPHRGQRSPLLSPSGMTATLALQSRSAGNVQSIAGRS